MRDHSIVIKPRRRGTNGMAFLLLLLLCAIVIALGFGFFAPAKLALFQERAIGLLHGGVADIQERTLIDACVNRPQDEGTQAVTRTVRTTSFNDGTTLSVTFSSPPSPTNSQCR
jgi:hypothetical protein